MALDEEVPRPIGDQQYPRSYVDGTQLPAAFLPPRWLEDREPGLVEQVHGHSSRMLQKSLGEVMAHTGIGDGLLDCNFIARVSRHSLPPPNLCSPGFLLLGLSSFTFLVQVSAAMAEIRSALSVGAMGNLLRRRLQGELSLSGAWSARNDCLAV